MTNVLIRIGTAMAWVAFFNFCVFVRNLWLGMDRLLTVGEKYFTRLNIVVHAIATVLGVLVGLEMILY